MRQIEIDESAFASKEEVHAFLADQLGFPAYYGANLDALNDCLADIGEAVAITVDLADYPPAAPGAAYGQVGEAAGGPVDEAAWHPLYTWFPRLCKTLLRASRANPCVRVLVNLGSIQALERIVACPGLPQLLAEDEFTVRAILACFPFEDD